jgi:hypothetical protein
MKNLLGKKVPYGVAFAILGSVLIFACGHTALAQLENREEGTNGTRLVGTWLVQVTPHNCQTGVQSESFQSILAIGAGGIVIDTTGNPIFQPGQRTSGLGIWKHTGRDTYELLSNAFLLDSLTKPLPPPFQPGTQQIVQHITLKNGNEFTSNATIQFSIQPAQRG